MLDQIRYHGYTKSGMRKAGQYCVQLYEDEFEKFRGAGMVRLVSENITDFYELVDEEVYCDDTGLDLGIDFGMAVMM